MGHRSLAGCHSTLRSELCFPKTKGQGPWDGSWVSSGRAQLTPQGEFKTPGVRVTSLMRAILHRVYKGVLTWSLKGPQQRKGGGAVGGPQRPLLAPAGPPVALRGAPGDGSRDGAGLLTPRVAEPSPAFAAAGCEPRLPETVSRHRLSPRSPCALLAAPPRRPSGLSRAFQKCGPDSDGRVLAGGCPVPPARAVACRRLRPLRGRSSRIRSGGGGARAWPGGGGWGDGARAAPAAAAGYTQTFLPLPVGFSCPAQFLSS